MSSPFGVNGLRVLKRQYIIGVGGRVVKGSKWLWGKGLGVFSYIQPSKFVTPYLTTPYTTTETQKVHEKT